ncbi:MAG: PadR family transcriptional regulator [Actinomycetota bacterium]|nr:MAG: PadR family transcriptional regulator [Actinomycetota bacterium]
MNQIKRINKYSPLTESMFYILIALLMPLHGYGIMQKVEKLSEGRIRLGPGTLYGALSNLVEAKLIIPEDGRQDPGSRRKVYSITEFGIELIGYEIKRLEEMLKNAKLLLKERGQ